LQVIKLSLESKKVNMFSLNAVESKEDIKLVRETLGTKGKHISIIAKI